ncbi:DUF2339 domain-containing protein [Allohahella marinimesophila]|uniref:Membrane protein DUF2339 n=1 Tax=Allohahella marinimesophila TaxID=1054972 RepID=A0ABP7NRT2_9GAMM
MVAGLIALFALHDFTQSEGVLFNANMSAAAILALLYLWLAIFGAKHSFSEIEKSMGPALHTLVWLAVGLLLGFGLRDIEQSLGTDSVASAFLLYATLILLIFFVLHRRTGWQPLSEPLLLILPLLGVTLLSYVTHDQNLSSHYGWVIFPMALAAHYLMLRHLEQVARYPLGMLHLATFLIVTLAVGWQLSKWLQPPQGIWATSAWGFTLVSAWVISRQLRNMAWPFQQYSAELVTLLPRCLVVMLSVWLVAANLGAPGAAGGLAYLPLLNPLDVISLSALAVVMAGVLRYDPTFIEDRRIAYGLPGAMAFLWLNAALLRTYHYWLDIPYRFEPLFRSFAVESGLSILWSTIGLVAMVIATRRGWRPLWLIGSALMVAVVLKLFTVDMAGTGTVSRIVAFLGVGILLLIVGYFAPVPPRQIHTAAPTPDPAPGA